MKKILKGFELKNLRENEKIVSLQVLPNVGTGVREV